MSKIILCARCYATPPAPRKTFDFMRSTEVDGKPEWFCSEAHMHHSETPVAEAARIGIAFMNATMMMHMFMTIGRTDDPSFDIIQARRVAMADRLQVLGAMDELKELAL